MAVLTEWYLRSMVSSTITAKKMFLLSYIRKKQSAKIAETGNTFIRLIFF
jgi:hypothetical protein